MCKLFDFMVLSSYSIKAMRFLFVCIKRCCDDCVFLNYEKTKKDVVERKAKPPIHSFSSLSREALKKCTLRQRICKNQRPCDHD